MSRHLMARFRHLHAVAGQGPSFDWKQTDPNAPCPICPYERPHRDRILHVAPLENGHELHAWSFDGRLWPNESDGEPRYNLGPKELGWSWAIVDPSKYPKEPNKYELHQDPDHHLAGNGGDGPRGEDDPWHRDYIPSLEDAKAEAEEHYKKMFPLGTDTGKHDSGVDYSDLNKFMGEL